MVCEEADQNYLDNCFEYEISYRHPGNTELNISTATSTEDCQNKCINHTRCDHFSFNTTSTK